MLTRLWMLMSVIGIAIVAAGAIALSTMTTIDQPLRLDDEATEWPEIQISADKKAYVELSRRGGTGYTWEATTADPKIALIERLRSRVEKPKSDNPAVGRSEIDLFKITAVATGQTKVLFDLRRVRSDPIKSIAIQVSVTQ